LNKDGYYKPPPNLLTMYFVQQEYLEIFIIYRKSARNESISYKRQQKLGSPTVYTFSHLHHTKRKKGKKE